MATLYSINTGTAAVALAAATAKTALMVIPGATKQAVITEFSISFDGVTASAVPVLVELVFSTQVGAGTPGASPTPDVLNGLGASVSTAAINYSAEPTVLNVVKQWLVTPNGGLLVIQSPLGRETKSNLSGSATAKGVGIRLTAPAIVNYRGYVEFEE